MTQRSHYLDNLRAFTILMLFPFHVFMIYNNWGESFYIHSTALFIPSVINRFFWFWMMPLLFVIAGMSSRYALQKRNASDYAKERVNKLLVPLVFGIILIIPIQSYLAGVYWNGSANYFDYFTKLTDFTGYDGAFTPGQLWFILFLFVISMVSLPFMILYKKKGKGTLGRGVPLVVIMLMGILPCLGNELFDISGKSPTEYLVYFLLGYFFLANDAMLEKLDTYRFLLLGSFALGAGLTIYFDGVLFEAVSWLSVLTILGMARHYLNFNGKITGYFSKSSFGIYVYHQSWIVIMGFFAIKLTDNYWVQVPLVLVSSVALTYLTYEIARRVSVLRFMFGLKR